jgi:hypothetical protein
VSDLVLDDILVGEGATKGGKKNGESLGISN